MYNEHEQLTIDHEEVSRPVGVYELIRGLDKNVRELSGELYIFRRETEHKFKAMAEDISSLKKDTSELKRETANLKEDVSELKQEVKEIKRDISDIKGDLKAISAGFTAMQTRFNWWLVIAGLVLAALQYFKG